METVLFNLVDAVNETFFSYGLPPHFDKSMPHMSFAWTDVEDTLNIINSPYSVDEDGDEDIEIGVHYVVCNWQVSLLL